MSPQPTPSRRILAPDLVAWLGVAPFFVFAAMFLIVPTASLFTLANLVRLGQPSIRLSYWLSLQVSAASAVLGALMGLALALAALKGGLPSWLRPTLMTFSGVASNFAGVPLAFAFMATLGRLGLVTVLLRNVGIDLYAQGFNILTFWGLTITYLYFQIPLMVLVVTHSIDGLRRE
jgi:putative spermidine/putrescine transport system permease protein